MRKIKLSENKSKWVANRKDIVLHGTRLNYSVSDQRKYAKELNSLIEDMTRITKEEVIKFFNKPVAKEFYKGQKESAAQDASISSGAKKITDALTDRFNRLFGRKAKKIAESMVNQSSKTSESMLKSSLKMLSGGLVLETGILTSGLKEITKAAINENVSLIKTIASTYLSNVEKAVMRSITTGNGLKDLIPAIEKYDGITKRHAKNVALDQTRKVYNAINKGRMQAVGIKKFEWKHSAGGQKPRKSHISMSGNIYSFDDLPIVNKEQVDAGYASPERGIPGQAINCKCTMNPVIEFDEGEQDAT